MFFIKSWLLNTKRKYSLFFFSFEPKFFMSFVWKWIKKLFVGVSMWTMERCICDKFHLKTLLWIWHQNQKDKKNCFPNVCLKNITRISTQIWFARKWQTVAENGIFHLNFSVFYPICLVALADLKVLFSSGYWGSFWERTRWATANLQKIKYHKSLFGPSDNIASSTFTFTRVSKSTSTLTSQDLLQT